MVVHRQQNTFGGRIFAGRGRTVAAALLFWTPVQAGTTSAAVPWRAPLTVVAKTTGPLTGAVRFALFDRAAAGSWGDSVLAAALVPVCSSSTVWTTPPLFRGSYALAVFHDLNANEVLDKNVVGMPAEPYGFSNNARNAIGPPSIREATFRFNDTAAVMVVELR